MRKAIKEKQEQKTHETHEANKKQTSGKSEYANSNIRSSLCGSVVNEPDSEP